MVDAKTQLWPSDWLLHCVNTFLLDSASLRMFGKKFILLRTCFLNVCLLLSLLLFSHLMVNVCSLSWKYLVVDSTVVVAATKPDSVLLAEFSYFAY